MWGDPERAISIEQGSDYLATLLFQISSPAHIPWGDQRWQELLHGYDVWVHMDDNNPLMEQACRSMTKHAELSSNLAALSLHVTRMLRDLVNDIRALQSEPEADFSQRISSIAKARAVAGALQLLRLLSHPMIVEASKEIVDDDKYQEACKEITDNDGVNYYSRRQKKNSKARPVIKDAFMYKTRGDLPTDNDTGLPLMHSLLDFIAILETGTAVSTSTTKTEVKIDVLRIPEIYDAAIFSFRLFFVLCGTQLYQPFYSSFESDCSSHYFLHELFQQTDGDKNENIDDRSMASNSSRSVENGSSIHSKRKGRHNHKRSRKLWTPKTILKTCFQWQLHRPPAPQRSISHHHNSLAQLAVDAKGGEKPGEDGLYENYMVVQAISPIVDDPALLNSTLGDPTNHVAGNQSDNKSGSSETYTTRKSLVVGATKEILTLSGSIIFLPFRLLKLVYGVISAGKNHKSHDIQQVLAMKKKSISRHGRTRDVLWLSNSLLADLGCSMILLLANNYRSEERGNAFRVELNNLTDNRWEHGSEGSILPELPNFKSKKEVNRHFQSDESEVNDQVQNRPLSTNQQKQNPSSVGTFVGEHNLTLNFESLFLSFARTLHNELGAFLLYTIIHSSPSFAKSLGVRSDLDIIVMPLLRTLYFASRGNTFMAKDYKTKKRPQTSSKGTSGTISDICDCPFRSQSQLYVIIILLLIFSQDSSFGRDVFRRINVNCVPWYKERRLKCINLGSVIVLTMLRSLLFNLNRLRDRFLLNNCCAVLENLSPSVAYLHEYAAMRLVNVTVLVMKKHAKLAAAVSDKGNNVLPTTENGEQQHSPLSMYSEVSHTLLGIIKHGLSATNIEGNPHLIYALLYHQVDFLNLCTGKYSVDNHSGKPSKRKLYSSKQTARIVSVIRKASEFIQKEGTRSAPKVLKLIERNVSDLKAVVNIASYEISNKYHPSNKKDVAINGRSISNRGDGDKGVNDMANNISSAPCAATAEEEFTFLYEEESDPESFFVPYLWEIIVSVVSAGSMEWKKDDIKVFALLDGVDEQDIDINFDYPGTGNFSLEADEMV